MMRLLTSATQEKPKEDFGTTQQVNITVHSHWKIDNIIFTKDSISFFTSIE